MLDRLLIELQHASQHFSDLELSLAGKEARAERVGEFVNGMDGLLGPIDRVIADIHQEIGVSHSQIMPEPVASHETADKEYLVAARARPRAM